MKRLPVLVLLAAGCLSAQSKTLSNGAQRIELTIERRVNNAWRAVDPGLIFDSGDRVRFRYKTNFGGFLYVMNHGTAGTYMQLFPSSETGTANRVDPDKEYIVPATDGAFRVAGPPGHDVIYFTVMPVEVTSGSSYKPLPPPPPTPARHSLTPRCDDAILRARGECVDSSAGAANADPDKLPANLKPRGGQAQGPELIIRKQRNAALLSSRAPLGGPVTFEFRLAHK